MRPHLGIHKGTYITARSVVVIPASARCRFSSALGAFGRCRHKRTAIAASSSLLSCPRIRRRETWSAAADDPTIYALSTAPGRSAIAIIRVSGSACRQIYHALCPNTKIPKPRYAAFRALYEPAGDAPKALDSGALVLYFPGPKTVTGEDVLELHVHGGPAVVKAVLAAIPRCASPTKPIQYAEPGEFTRRAFMNDRIDLTQVEALGDTLSAVTEEQRRLSVQGTTSGLSKRYEEWRRMLLYARGELEALIDFSEDQHFDESPAALASNVAKQVEKLLRAIRLHSANAVRGELLRNGIGISLIGAPNVGKSSLLNQLVGRNAAIVSREAGTTRDVVEVGIDLGGFFCRLGDTAGLRGSAGAEAAIASAMGEVEKEGIERAKARAMQSDVVLLVLAVEASADGQGHQLHVEPEVIETTQQLRTAGKRILVIVNKMDRLSYSAQNTDPNDTAEASDNNRPVHARVSTSVQQILPALDTDSIFCISCRHAHGSRYDMATDTSSGESALLSEDAHYNGDPGGVQRFLDGLVSTFRDITSAVSDIDPLDSPSDKQPSAADTSAHEEALGATERQRVLLDTCAQHMQRFLNQVRVRPPTSSPTISKVPEKPNARTQGQHEADTPIPNEYDDQELDIVVATESLRSAADCLARITGRGEAGDVEEVLGVVFEKFCVGK